ncbi:peptidoglycan-binding protein [Thalassobaculum sp. OXR-137]|uniref:peptidoglycan-binding protein n=1 Tax=Thalassobaculum sp. OXR-137 TaxID=3100173 RepID=UPI002AC9A629|nr:peptidoglycan-binding protein [Thalassobaculum sp. OXR-137]WPZ35458.1 peptidoglycan-binding protein [Thalassobaculum sp. OXR-137]
MSRDTTAWSVKGVDQATRDIARRAAAAAGMTIGEWIDHAIKSDSTNRGIPVPADRGGAQRGPAAPRPDGISADTVEAIFSRISDGERLFEARLRPIGYALKDVAERVVALEREAERLPPPTAHPEPEEVTPPPPPQIEAAPQPEPEPEPTPPPAPQPIRTPIAFRPIRTPEPPPATEPRQEVPQPAADEDIWDSETPGPTADEVTRDLVEVPPPPEPERPKPAPIVLRPVPPAPPEPVEEEETFEPIQQDTRPVPPLPGGPPAGWEPEIEIDRTALAFAAEDLRDRDTPKADPEPEEAAGPDLDAAAVLAETWEPARPDEIPPPPEMPPETVSKPQRPEPTPPSYDFPADPIDTRALGLSGEPIREGLPARRQGGGVRLAIAAAIVLMLIGGALWSAHRQGTLNLDALGNRLAEAQSSVQNALAAATDWVRQGIGSTSDAPQDVAAPAPGPEPLGSVASAPPPLSPPPHSTAPSPVTGSSPTADTTPAPAGETGSAPAEPGAGAPTETASVAETAIRPAPPLPDKPIAVDPRPVAPPPAPALVEPPRRASAAAAPTTEGAAPLSRAEAGNPAAQFEVAAAMMRAAEPRPAEAATWFREAAINGLDVAQFNLGVMYERGLGVPEDETRALLWYHSAAEQGFPLAQYNLGRLYALGKGIPQSDAEAKRWFQRAAERGVSEGFYEIARFEPDELERERKMYDAAKAGAEGAQEWLRTKSAGGLPEAPLGPAAGLVLDPPTGAPDIAEIQEGLTSLGYYDGPVDGIAGPMTRAAISKFQSDNGLPATGLPSRSLRQRLN